MTKLELKLQEIKQRKKIGIMTHVVIGYPTLQDTRTIVKTMAENGVDIVELQIPFSDPLADGPTIMKACEASLQTGTKVKDAFELMQQLSQEMTIPLVFMGYFNTMFCYGVEKFCQDAQKVGASGLIFPDMPLDEEPEEHYEFFAKKYNLAPIRVVSPVSTKERLQKNAKSAHGFVYCTSRIGTTGIRDDLDPNLASYLKKVKNYFDIPVAVGFGISQREHIQALTGHADIAVIGSALIEVINQSQKHEIDKNVSQFLKSLLHQR